MQITIKKLLSYCALCYCLLFSFPCRGDIPPELEGIHAKATDLLYQGKWEEALALLGEYPSQASEFLELKALIFRQLGDRKSAKDLYLSLLEGNPSEASRSAYFFELGAMEFEDKSYAAAILYFEKTLASGYNVELSHYYLGASHFELKNWNEARDHFYEIADVKDETIQLKAHAYLKIIHEDYEQGMASKRHLVLASDEAKKIRYSENSKDSIYAFATEVAEEAQRDSNKRQRGTYFGAIGIFGGNDSNVFSVPADSSITNADGPFLGLRYLGGYLQNDTAGYQWAPVYSGTLSQYTKEESKGGSVFSHSLTLQGTHDPYRVDNFGFKTSLNFLLQNHVYSSGYKYGPHALGTELRLFKRWSKGTRWAFGIATTGVFSKDYLDEYRSDEGKKGGYSQSVEAYVARIDHAPYWSPVLSLALNASVTRGSENKRVGSELSLSNPMSLSQHCLLIPALQLASGYFHSSPTGIRMDISMLSALTAIYRFPKSSFEAFLDLGYQKGMSRVAQFEYGRFTVLTGVNVTF